MSPSSKPTARPRQAEARRSRDPVATRRALVDAAVELFSRDGFDATSVQSIVRQANLTKGSFYHHFESKVALLFEIHERFIDAHLVKIEEVLASDLPGDELLRLTVRDVIIQGAARFKAEVTIFYQELPRLTDDYLEVAMAKRDRFEGCIVEVIERGIADGSFAGVRDTHLTALAVLGSAAFSYHWIDPQRSDPEAIGDYFGELLLEGLRPRD